MLTSTSSRFGIFTYLNQGIHSTGCRTPAWALAQATADPAWAGMTARAVRRRKVCGAAGAAPQDVELLKARDGAPGPDELHVVGLDL